MGAPSRRRVPPLPATRLTPKCASRTLSARCSATPRRSARRQPHSAAQRRHVRCCVNEARHLHRVRGAAAWQGRVARWALACAPPASVQRCSLAHSVARLPHCPDLQRIWFRAHAYVCHCGTLAHRHTASACPRVRVGTHGPAAGGPAVGGAPRRHAARAPTNAMTQQDRKCYGTMFSFIFHIMITLKYAIGEVQPCAATRAPTKQRN